MKKPRHLSPEERALWDQVARTTDPLVRRARAPKAPPKAQNMGPNGEVSDRPLPEFRVGQSVDHSGDHDLLPSLSESLANASVAMDKKAFARMKRGKLKPEARIDLHGMTLAQAHPALSGFILSSQAANRRLVLVITGKGRPNDDGNPIPTRPGVLRHQVPQWLRMPPLAQAVLQVTEAHLRHGGHGAYYVYLRRRR